MRASSRWMSLVLIIALAACGRTAPSGPSRLPAPGEPSPAITETLELEASDVHVVAQALRGEVARLDGDVVHVEQSADRAHLELRVPAEHRDGLRAAILKLAKVQTDAEQMEDVGDQRVDLAARLRNARAEEQRLLQLLDQRTGSLTDVLVVEKELASTRESIERMDAQAQVLENRVELARVIVEIAQTSAPLWANARTRISDAAKTGFDVAGQVAIALVMAFAGLTPSVILIGILLLIARRLRRALARACAAPTR